MKWLIVLILAALIAVGCDQAEAPPSNAAPTAETVATNIPTTEAPAVPEVETTAEPDDTPSSEAPLPATAEPTDAPTDVPPTATVEEPPTEEAVAFNGIYEKSYFRGAANAPVTILDYSDFL